MSSFEIKFETFLTSRQIMLAIEGVEQKNLVIENIKGASKSKNCQSNN